MEEDTITIIIPVYNCQEYLDRCIKSVANQSYKNLEIILVDDGSTDDSGKICDKWKVIDSRISVIHKTNGGVSSARNIGIAKANGKYIGFVDSDDYCEEDMYLKMVNAIKNSGNDMVYCDIYKNRSYEMIGNKEEITPIERIKEIYPYGAAMWNGLYKSKIIKEIKFNEEIYYGEDLLFLTEYLKLCKKNIKHLKEPLYNYCVNEGSITLKSDRETALKKYYNYILAANLTLSELEKGELKLDYFYKRYIDLIYHICQKFDNIDYMNFLQEQLKKYRRYFNLKQKIYYCLLKINENMLNTIYKKL